MQLNELLKSYSDIRPGTKVYVPRKPFEFSSLNNEPWVQECVIEEVRQRWYQHYNDEKLEVKIKLYDFGHHYYTAWFKFENLGKTFFLTEEEAKEHLK